MKFVWMIALIVICGYPPSWAITIGSYNLHNLTDPQGLKADLSQLELVDVWGFQEVMFKDVKPQSVFQEILPSHLKHIYAVPIVSQEGDPHLFEGSAIVSRYPILRAGSFPLERGAQQARVAIYAILDVHGKQVLFVNTDHDIGYFEVGFVERQRNLKSLLDGIERLNFNGASVVVGDFNTADSFLNLRRGLSGFEEGNQTKKYFFARGWQSPPSQSQNEYTFGSYGIKQRLDYIFLKNINHFSQWFRWDRRAGSDHYPIYLIMDPK